MSSMDYDSPVVRCNLLPGHSDCKNQCEKGKCRGLPAKKCCGRATMLGADNKKASTLMEEALARQELA